MKTHEQFPEEMMNKILDFIKQFQDEESKSYKQTYDGFNITKNNIALLQKLRRKLKGNFLL